MRLLCWNCRGLGKPRTVRALRDIIRVHHPQVVCLMETKMQSAGWDKVKSALDF
ncbi:unnamed protein product [Rhodiola kirilowii]